MVNIWESECGMELSTYQMQAIGVALSFIIIDLIALPWPRHFSTTKTTFFFSSDIGGDSAALRHKTCKYNMFTRPHSLGCSFTFFGQKDRFCADSWLCDNRGQGSFADKRNRGILLYNYTFIFRTILGHSWAFMVYLCTFVGSSGWLSSIMATEAQDRRHATAVAACFSGNCTLGWLVVHTFDFPWAIIVFSTAAAAAIH